MSFKKVTKNECEMYRKIIIGDKEMKSNYMFKFDHVGYSGCVRLVLKRIAGVTVCMCLQ